jgi:hypothetical protein
VRRSTMMVLKSAEGLWLIATSMKVLEDDGLNKQWPATIKLGIMRKFAY